MFLNIYKNILNIYHPLDVRLLPLADLSGITPGDDICRNGVVLGGGFGGPAQKTITKVEQHNQSITSSNNLQYLRRSQEFVLKRALLMLLPPLPSPLLPQNPARKSEGAL